MTETAKPATQAGDKAGTRSGASSGRRSRKKSEVEQSYFRGGPQTALLEFVGDVTDSGLRKFIESFRSDPEIDLGIEFRTPSGLLTNFSPNTGWHVFEHVFTVVGAWAPYDGAEKLEPQEKRRRICQLDLDLLSRHVPSYRLPWRGNGKLYWHSHWYQLVDIVMRNPLLERALRKVS